MHDDAPRAMLDAGHLHRCVDIGSQLLEWIDLWGGGERGSDLGAGGGHRQADSERSRQQAAGSWQ